VIVEDHREAAALGLPYKVDGDSPREGVQMDNVRPAFIENATEVLGGPPVAPAVKFLEISNR